MNHQVEKEQRKKENGTHILYLLDDVREEEYLRKRWKKAD